MKKLNIFEVHEKLNFPYFYFDKKTADSRLVGSFCVTALTRLLSLCSPFGIRRPGGSYLKMSRGIFNIYASRAVDSAIYFYANMYT